MDTNEFVSKKLYLLAEDVNLAPQEVEDAWRRVKARASAPAVARRIPAPLLAVAAAAALLAAILIVPSTRAWAQSAWRSLVLWRAEPLSIDMANTSLDLLMPNVFPLHRRGEVWQPSDLAEAEKIANFHVVTLSSPLLPYRPSFRIEQQPEIARVVDLSAIRKELIKLDRPLVPAPAGIDGARVVLRPQGRLVVTSYGECPQIRGMLRACAFLVQARPKVLELPPGVSLEPFLRFSLQLAGLSEIHAERLLRMAGPDPAIFLPNEAGSTLEPVTVKGQRGVLVRGPGNAVHVLHWQDSEFHYELHVRDAERAVELAETAH